MTVKEKVKREEKEEEDKEIRVIGMIAKCSMRHHRRQVHRFILATHVLFCY